MGGSGNLLTFKKFTEVEAVITFIVPMLRVISENLFYSIEKT